jgi:riboflavin kinase/FMN adenylyltransferase
MNDRKFAAKPFTVIRDSAADALYGAVVALGNFDGVHRGHRAVIATALQRAASLRRKAAALTFAPHPRKFFQPQTPLFYLTGERDKLRLLAATGLNGAIILPFDAALAATPAQDFIERILIGHFGVSGVTIGFDFHFGQKRQGTPNYLQRQGLRLGFPVDIVPQFSDAGKPVSSGAIRAALTEGKVTEAADMLGAPWFVSGEVIHGDKRGRELGFPTANIKLDPDCGLRHGIYAVRVGIPDSAHSRASGNPEAAESGVAGSPPSRGRAVTLYDGVASFGLRPMFETETPLLEVFLFDFAGDLYGRTIDVAFIAWLRGEKKFASLDDLKAAIAADSANGRTALKAAGAAFPVLGKI